MTLSCRVGLWEGQREFYADIRARRAMSETAHSGLDSYLLLFVDFRPPAPNRASPASIDCSQVLSSALFTVQFNQTLER